MVQPIKIAYKFKQTIYTVKIRVLSQKKSLYNQATAYTVKQTVYVYIHTRHIHLLVLSS